MSLSFEEETERLHTKWTAKALREAEEAGLTYTVDLTDPDWSVKLDKFHSGELVIKNGALVPNETVKTI